MKKWRDMKSAPRDGTPVLLKLEEMTGEHVGYFVSRDVYEYGKLVTKQRYWKIDAQIYDGTPYSWTPK